MRFGLLKELRYTRSVPKPTELGTIFGITALYVVLPVLLTFVIALAFPSLGALVLTLITLGFIGLGAWVFAAWF